MSGAENKSVRQARIELVARLRSRSSEIEEAILARVLSLSGPANSQDPDYLGGLRTTVAETLNYGLKAVEEGEDWSEPVPLAAVAQARRAARYGVGLETVLRRYAAGDRIFAMYIVDEADALPRDVRQEIQRTHNAPVDRLMAAVASEYEEELARVRHSPTHQQQRRIRGLLSGDLESGRDLAYELGGWHVGMITSDSEAENWGRAISLRLDCQFLFVDGLEDGAWIWFGRKRPLSVEEIEKEIVSAEWRVDAPIAFGEPRLGLEGWRLTHMEAQAVLETIVVSEPAIARCRDVVVTAALMRDPVLAKSLLISYLGPLDRGSRATGAKFRKTLRAYFASKQNMSTAAALLGKERRTVKSHLEDIEERLGQRIEECHAELQIALDVEETMEAQRKAGKQAPNEDAQDNLQHSSHIG